MFNLFKRKPAQTELSLTQLPCDGYCAVVGESYYQEALRATSQMGSLVSEGNRTFTAVLVSEPDDPYDHNAVAIHSPIGKVGHLSRGDAAAYRDVFDELARLGSDGGVCEARLTGGEPAKPSFGVVLQLADPETCLADLRDAYS